MTRTETRTDMIIECLKLRSFEEKILELFDLGQIVGTTHTAIGQELITYFVSKNLTADDFDMRNHRCHGHFLLFTGLYTKLANELMGLSNGLNEGKAGSQHLITKNFISNGILGGGVPIATGISYANKFFHSDSLVINYLGDGVFGEGVLYESFNLASLLKCPIIFIVENNKYAQSTKIQNSLSGSIEKRFEAFSIDSSKISFSDDVIDDFYSFSENFKQVRKSQRPYAFIFDTYRLAPHSKGDDNRSDSEIEHYKKIDPLNRLLNSLDDDEISDLKNEVQNFVDKIFENKR